MTDPSASESKPEVRRPSLKARLLLAVLAVTVAVGLIEVALQLFLPGQQPMRFNQVGKVLQNHLEEKLFESDPDRFWRFVPGITRPDDDSPFIGVVSNGQGLREDHEIPPTRGADEIRLLFLGDSSCFGVWLDHQDTFVHQVELTLTQRSPSTRVECINAGVPGYTIFQGFQQLKSIGAACQPDLIVLYFGWNSMIDWDGRSDRQHWEDLQAVQPPEPLRWSRLCQVIWSGLFGRDVEVAEEGGKSAGQLRVSTKQFAELLGAIEETAREQDADVLIIVAASRNNLRRPDISPHQRELFRFGITRPPAGQRGCIGYVDCVTLVKELRRSRSEKDVFLDDLHPTASTNRRIARAIVEKIGPWFDARLRVRQESK